MRSFGRTALAVTLAVAGGSGQSSKLPPELLNLVNIKQRMLRSLTKIPDYTCLETLERSMRLKENIPFKPVDRLRMEVLYAGDREYHAWPGSRNFEPKNAPRLLAGVSSKCELASHAHSVVF